MGMCVILQHTFTLEFRHFCSSAAVRFACAITWPRLIKQLRSHCTVSGLAFAVWTTAGAATNCPFRRCFLL